jgi:hypothetical protein
MANVRPHDAAIRRFSKTATIFLSVAVIGIPYALNRAYRRWLAKDDPIEELRAYMGRLEASYRDKRETVIGLAWGVGEVLIAVAGARFAARAAPSPHRAERVRGMVAGRGDEPASTGSFGPT